MERRTFGKTGLSVSPLGFGGSEIGFEGKDVATVEKLLGSALDAGLNVIDTAECYRGSEELIGRAVGSRRDEFHLFTKVGHNGAEFGLPDWDLGLLEKSIERSLRDLRTDRLDLVQLHGGTIEQLRQGDIITVLQRARDAGKTRFIGYSGDQDAALFAVQTGAFDTLQTSLNIADQEPLTLTLPAARERNMGVIAKRPIANAAWRHTERPEGAYGLTYWDRLQELRYPFLDADPESVAATALRFTLSAPGVHVAIVGTAKPGRWQQNAAVVARGPLPPAQFDAIRDRWRAVAGPDWRGQG